MKLLIYIILTQIIIQDGAEVWNWISPDAKLGGEISQNLPGLSWPGNDTINNYYLHEAYFILGAKENGNAYVRNNYEWAEGNIIYHGPGVSEEDVIVLWHDSLSNQNVPSGKHTGIDVICKSYTWSFEPWNDFIAYEFFVIWNKDQCDIPNAGESLDSVFIGIYYDFDISGTDSNPGSNDIVSFDGYVAGEWSGYPYDSITLLPDTFLNTPDGIYDQYIVYGNDSLEHTIHGDTLVLPRNLSYGYDLYGNNGKSDGYVGYSLLYAPLSPADTSWVDAYGDTCRIPRVWAHQWWNFENAPISDDEWYLFMEGNHPATQNLRFVPPPSGPAEEHYAGLQTSGPFKIFDGETLKFVWVAAIGQKMNGGKDTVFERGWIRGIRQTVDYALTAYYTGSQISDPYHPSGPDEDIHWGIIAIKEKENLKNINLFLLSILTSSFEIFDILGRKIKKVRVKDGDKPFRDLKGGIYILKVGKQRHKIIVLK